MPPSTRTLDLSVDLTDACRRLTAAVPHPPLTRGDDVELAIVRYQAALEIANDRLGATAGCISDLSGRYAAQRRAGN